MHFVVGAGEQIFARTPTGVPIYIKWNAYFVEH